MRICRIGIRNNLYYPLMLIIFVLIRKIDEIIITFDIEILNYKGGFFIIPFIIFFSQFLAGLIHIFKETCNKNKESKNNRKYIGIELIQNATEITQSDSQVKIYILILFASYFNYVGSLIRKNDTNFELENRTRSFQIIFCALLCYFTIKTNIYKHQMFSLIIIFIIMIIILVFDFSINKETINLLGSYGYGIFSCLSRAFLDTIEKYLFEFDYLNPYKVLMLEGLIGCLLIPILLFFDTTYNDFDSFIYIINNGNITGKRNIENIILLIILLIIYLILTYFKNIYRVLTIKTYSPMTRALTESIIDPFDFICQIFIKNNNDRKIKCELLYYSFILILLFITSFLSLIYNDFIVLYCCGLEYNTHLEIHKRAISYENLNGDLFEEEEDDNEDNVKAELADQIK